MLVRHECEARRHCDTIVYFDNPDLRLFSIMSV